jgi:hypothetical protein
MANALGLDAAAVMGPTAGMMPASASTGAGVAPQTTVSPSGEAAKDTGASAKVANALKVGNTSSPLVGAMVMGGLLVGLTYLANHVGEEKEFGHIGPGFYNALVISLAAVVGIPIWKQVFTLVPVPGVSSYVMSV